MDACEEERLLGCQRSDWRRKSFSRRPFEKRLSIMVGFYVTAKLCNKIILIVVCNRISFRLHSQVQTHVCWSQVFSAGQASIFLYRNADRHESHRIT
ncbi:hypothetical protein MPTK1_6g03650 [Marchantia polymorpha subsp. ruderalis]|uniref:Uncharacterized protein n=2 Tax=Marchantia polymorpha TaxID=3197 RepID=A0AAF6BN74_MARPO|nr:hypothetical protein MARPO_0035s0144 [Marchantia polymorpha]BBN13458.1 hypothetical protein Mp_6g03650 [Marchantia polymorpha subsp. ruderalis]|eukprot:PTQ41378.1 hypothetical protein MARPO_0035s0144 [Marchantia polymorpha]